MQRVKITKTPILHGSGKGSRPCTCKGQFGNVLEVVSEGNQGIAFVQLDKGGRVGVPTEDLYFIKGEVKA